MTNTVKEKKSSDKEDLLSEIYEYSDIDREVIRGKLNLTGSIKTYQSYVSLVSKRFESDECKEFKIANRPMQYQKTKESNIVNVYGFTSNKMDKLKSSKCISKKKKCLSETGDYKKKLFLQQKHSSKEVIAKRKDHTAQDAIDKLMQYEQNNDLFYDKKLDCFYIRKTLQLQVLNPIKLHLNSDTHFCFYDHVFPNDSSLQSPEISDNKPVSIFGNINMIKRLIKITYNKKKDIYSYKLEPKDNLNKTSYGTNNSAYPKEWLHFQNHNSAYELHQILDLFVSFFL